MFVEIAASRPGLRNLYQGLSAEVRGFFSELPCLIDSAASLDTILAYAYFRLEQGQHLALLYGARKLHKTDAELTKRALDSEHITRESYRTFFGNIYGFPLDADTIDCLAKADGIRDRLMHGKTVTDGEKREAISRALCYAERVNHLIDVSHRVGLRPYNHDNRGVVGALGALDKNTSRWVLKGIGFSLR
jgi:hypothetical protein